MHKPAAQQMMPALNALLVAGTPRYAMQQSSSTARYVSIRQHQHNKSVLATCGPVTTSLCCMNSQPTQGIQTKQSARSNADNRISKAAQQTYIHESSLMQNVKLTVHMTSGSICRLSL